MNFVDLIAKKKSPNNAIRPIQADPVNMDLSQSKLNLKTALTKSAEKSDISKVTSSEQAADPVSAQSAEPASVPDTILHPPSTDPEASESAPASTVPDDAIQQNNPEQPKETEPENDLNSLYDKRPQGMYDLAAQLGIEIPANKDETLKKAAACLSTVFNGIDQNQRDQHILWSMTKSVASDIEGIIDADSGVVTELQRYRINRDRLIWHSIYTAILAMELANETNDLPCSVQEIGAAALLHDIGILVLPELLNKMHQENTPNYKEHVTQGVMLAKRMTAPASVLTMIAQHHERIDGKGFPNGTAGDEILASSQIVAISNLFEHAQINLTSPGTNQTQIALVDMPQLLKIYRKAFDSDLLKKMIKIIGFYPVGSIVELNNRSICEVVRQNPDFPLRPVVKVIMDSAGNHPEPEKTIDLHKVELLSVTKSIMRGREEK